MEQEEKLLPDPEIGAYSKILTRHRRRRIFFRAIIFYFALLILAALAGGLWSAYRTALGKTAAELYRGEFEIDSILILYFRCLSLPAACFAAGFVKISHLVNLLTVVLMGAKYGAGAFSCGIRISHIFYEGLAGDIYTLVLWGLFSIALCIFAAASSSYRISSIKDGTGYGKIFTLTECFMYTAFVTFIISLLLCL